MNRQDMIDRLAKGETIQYREKGNSMLPLIESGALLTAVPASVDSVEVGDVVFCRVKGNFYTHKVTAKGDRGAQISNNNGHVNGWTRSVFGKVVRIET